MKFINQYCRTLAHHTVSGFNRIACQHEIVSIPNHEGIAWDDVWRFNPQAGSQWDGFRHFSTVTPDGRRAWYGGTTSKEITDSESDRIGVGHWAQDGIAARGFLIDYVSYAQQKGLDVNGMSGHAITLEEVQEIAKQCNITIKPGDIFFLRCGFTQTWNSLSPEQKQQYRENTLVQKHAHSGLIQSEAVIRFMWDNHIVAVAGDGVSFEVRPARDHEWNMHKILLAGWGVPIGEMFDLERLAELCKRLNRWTFFVSSAPLNHPRGLRRRRTALPSSECIIHHQHLLSFLLGSRWGGKGSTVMFNARDESSAVFHHQIHHMLEYSTSNTSRHATSRSPDTMRLSLFRSNTFTCKRS